MMEAPAMRTALIGAALLIPQLRRWAGGKLAQRARARRDDHVIDLEPGEWHQIPDRRRRRGKSNGV